MPHRWHRNGKPHGKPRGNGNGKPNGDGKPKPDRLEMRAVREGWLLAPAEKARIVKGLLGLISRPPGRPAKDYRPPDPELYAHIARTLIYGDIQQQRLDVLRARHGGGAGIRIDEDMIDEAERRAFEYEGQRRQEEEEEGLDSSD
jgi:hypothetical protein